jgi:hypothetical protein
MRVSPSFSTEQSIYVLPSRIRPAISAVIAYVENVISAGTVKCFNPVRGFGFIQPDDGSPPLGGTEASAEV